MKENKEDFRGMADALSQAIGRLIEAQDQECMRIARELHNNIGPSLAILGIDLLKLGQLVLGSPGAEHPDVQQAYQKLQEIGSQVSRLSNQLSPSMLRYFGLAKAIEIECNEYSGKNQTPVSYSCENYSAKPDPVFALHILRVVQEALRNAGRHSRATRVSVDVTATPTEFILRVSDNGVGFDVEQTNIGAGLGLISMLERMRLIGGKFEVRSQPGQGVKISCRAPLVQSRTTK